MSLTFPGLTHTVIAGKHELRRASICGYIHLCTIDNLELKGRRPLDLPAETPSVQLLLHRSEAEAGVSS